jgi:hypothetical protein
MHLKSFEKNALCCWLNNKSFEAGKNVKESFIQGIHQTDEIWISIFDATKTWAQREKTLGLIAMRLVCYHTVFKVH